MARQDEARSLSLVGLLNLTSYRASKIASHIGVASAIWIVAFMLNSREDDSFSGSLGLGLIASLLNIIPIYACFRLDKALASLEASGIFVSILHPIISRSLKRRKIESYRERQGRHQRDQHQASAN